MIWQTDEACVEAREEVLDRVYTLGLFTAKGRYADINDALDAYARAVVVALLKAMTCMCRTISYHEREGWVCDRCRMLAELGGAE